jgi:hypothetical protein
MKVPGVQDPVGMAREEDVVDDEAREVLEDVRVEVANVVC